MINLSKKERENTEDGFQKALNATMEQFKGPFDIDAEVAKEMTQQVLKKIGVQKDARKAVEEALLKHYGDEEMRRYGGHFG